MSSYPCGADGVGVMSRAGGAGAGVGANSRAQWVVVGVSGVTCGGKTTLANRLKETLSPCYVFHQDKYFFPDWSPKHVRVPGLAHNNYDVLSALDMAAMRRDVARAVAGDGAAHDQSHSGKVKIEGKKFLVVEGFTVLNYKPILEMCDLRYYFVLSYSQCAARRALRLYEPPDVDGYFERCVWPEHLKYRAEIEKDGRIRQLDGMEPDALDIVLQDVRDLARARDWGGSLV